MIQFELRDAVRNFMTEQETTVTFNMRVVIGIVGNTYPSFLNSENSINIVCETSSTGDEMKAKINAECLAYVAENFPTIS